MTDIIIRFSRSVKTLLHLTQRVKHTSATSSSGALHLNSMWLESIRLHLQRKCSFFGQDGDSPSLIGSKPGPLDQPAQYKHPFLPISHMSDLQAVGKR